MSFKDHCPIIQKLINNWKKSETTKRAKTFKKKDLNDYYLLPHTSDNLPVKAFSIVATACAGRKIEVFQLLHTIHNTMLTKLPLAGS
jgi:hypothetical protein